MQHALQHGTPELSPKIISAHVSTNQLSRIYFSRPPVIQTMQKGCGASTRYLLIPKMSPTVHGSASTEPTLARPYRTICSSRTQKSSAKGTSVSAVETPSCLRTSHDEGDLHVLRHARV